MSGCAGEPVSWLRLERYHAGELGEGERRSIAAHLGACPACAACIATIAADARALPPLPLPATPVAPVTPARRPRPFARAAAVASGFALAALVALVLGRPPPRPPAEGEQAPGRTKGGNVAAVLVRDDGAEIAEAGGAYRDGDRWKALVTCPPSMKAHWDLAVFEGGEVSFPLAPSEGLACGNAVPLPGAFRLTGRERLSVCVVWAPDGPVDREALRRAAPEPPALARCTALEPAP